MTRLLLCLAIGALIVLPFAASPGGAAAQPTPLIVEQGSQGLEFGQVIDDTGQIRFTDEIAQRIAESGATWVHINFRLGGFQNWTETSTFGYSALSLYDEVVTTAERYGLRVVGLLSNEAWHGGVDDWQANSLEAAGGNGDNIYLQEFAREAAVVLAVHFADRIDHWEVWNEPNALITYLHPSNFAWLLAHVYLETRAAGVTTARFISGGLSSKQASDGQTTAGSTGAEYLAATYTQGKALAGWDEIRNTHGSYPLDAIGQHIYVDGYEQTERETVRSALQLLRESYVAAEGGDGSKRTIITEIGWASDNVSERVQADNLQRAFAELMATPYVETASWFFLRDEPAADLAFGLLRSDGAEKLAWHGYRVITTPEAPPLPPLGLVAAGFRDEIRLVWHANAAPDLAGYFVWRASDPAGPFSQLTPEPLDLPAYVDGDVPIGQPVYYRVTAIDTGGHASPDSATVGAMRVDLPGLEPFARTWARTDLPVADGRVQRTWMWGAQPLTGIMTERYEESPGGFRQVQYYDKSRMELTHPDADSEAEWFVTNGLLVVELMSGWMQIGDSDYVEREPAAVNVAGDPESGPTYASLSPLRWASAREEDKPIIQRVSAGGSVSDDPSLAERDVKTAHFVPPTGHTVAQPFWDFMNSKGLIDNDGQEADDTLFIDPFYATGFPITEAYWTTVEVNEVSTDVLIQCFQRRCLTFTPDNADGWQIEAGNVGWHYYQWRYNQIRTATP